MNTFSAIQQGYGMSDEAAYNGVDVLEVMSGAENYNRFLHELVIDGGNIDGKVADFGAGMGLFADMLHRDGCDVMCIEPDEGLRRKLTEKGLTVCAGIADLEDNSIDYVYSLNVLEHVEHDSEALAEIFRILRPGKRLMLYVPAFMVLYTSVDRKIGHYRRYSVKELRQKLGAAGFEIEKSRYEDFLGFFVTLLYKALDRKQDGTINPSMLKLYDRWLFPLSRLLSRIFGAWIGKNAHVLAVKPGDR